MAGPRSWSGTGVRVNVSCVFETVDDLASVVTGVLSPDGPLGMLTHTLTDGLDTVWAAFFGSPIPPGGTNWNAYTHEQLYQMLWGEDADVGDVSTVAAEWGRHSDALTDFADALRGQREALLANWQGRAAELAGNRLGELSDKVWNVGARASTVQKAANDAGDALALARNTMPRPPPDPVTLMSSAVGAGPMNPVEAVLVGGTRVFTADAVAGASKAEAVRVMQRYEASLRSSGSQVVPGPSDATGSRSFGMDGPTSAAAATGGGATGGVPWSRLTGGAPLGPGGQVGAGPGPVQSVLAAERAALAAQAAAAQRAMSGGFLPSAMAGHGAQDDERPHRTRLPNVEHGLFALDERASDAVIGELKDREHDGGL
jgi:hypothetical protein